MLNGDYHHQVDGVALDSLLGPVLADILLVHREQTAANPIIRVLFYKRYIIDIIIFHASNNEASEICDCFNRLNLRIRNQRANAFYSFSIVIVPFNGVFITKIHGKYNTIIPKASSRSPTNLRWYIHFMIE